MSGFFVVRSEFFHRVVHNLSCVGFKILVDLLASSREPVRIGEVGFRFRHRVYGESKLDILVGLAELAETYLPELRRYRPRSTAAEFQRLLLRELDFGREERNLSQFRTNFNGNVNVRFPRPNTDLSTSHVLTMDYLDGIRLTEPQRLRDLGYDLPDVARRGADPKSMAEMHTFAGRTIDVPSMYVAGKSDWGTYQTPGAAEKMQTSACTRMVGFHLVDGAGHWVQQEQPEQVSELLIAFLRDNAATAPDAGG